jgi:hypothetical protein
MKLRIEVGSRGIKARESNTAKDEEITARRYSNENSAGAFLFINHTFFVVVVVVALLSHYTVAVSAYHCSAKHRVSRLCGCRLRRQQHGSYSVSIVATVTYGLFSKTFLSGIIVLIRLCGWEDCFGTHDSRVQRYYSSHCRCLRDCSLELGRTRMRKDLRL